ncbi:MAG TPA: TIGR03435 family protein [Gammaproteobacteria bacterium]|nr:TIGR03435 family protein [Gammaproteobacteria bacterium]
MLVDHVWQSTLVAGGLALLALTLREQAARIRCSVWLCASLKFLVPFAALAELGRQAGTRLLPVAVPSAQLPQSSTGGAALTALIERVMQPAAAWAPGDSFAAPDAAALAAPPALSLDVGMLLLFAWAAGSAAVLAIWLVRWLRLAALVRRARPVALEARLGAEWLDVRASATRIEPGVVGIVRPVLLLPEAVLARLTPAELAAIVEHELCHVRRRDNLAAAVHMLVEALFWFHPLVWWIGARFVDERERACDEAVVAAEHDAQTYAGAIVEVCALCARSPLACVVGIGGGGDLCKRVDRLLNAPAVRPLGVTKRFVLASGALAVLGVPIAVGLLNAPLARAQEASPPPAISAAGRDSPTPRIDGRGIHFLGPVIIANEVPLRAIVASAFRLQRERIAGPELLEQHYTLVAEMPSVDYHAEDPAAQYSEYLRSILEQRFGLVIHRDAKVMPALALVGGGQGLTLGSRNAPLLRSSADQLEGLGVSMDSLANYLGGVFKTPVLNQTNLTERYDFRLEWPMDAAGADQARLRQLLEERLGLRLLAVEQPVERIVVDRVTEPAAEPTIPEPAGNPAPVIVRVANPPPRDNGRMLTLDIDAHGAVYLDGGAAPGLALDPRALLAAATEAFRADPELTALVRADSMVANASIVEAANLLQAAGARRIRFATLWWVRPIAN